MGAVKSAITSLPCVEPSSVKVDIDTKEARFRVKPGENCDIEEVKKAISHVGNYSVSKVKAPAG